MSPASSAWGKRQAALLLAVFLVVTYFSLASERFRSPSVLLDQSCYWAEIGILAPFALLVIVTGGIDLSVASVLALVGVTVVRLHAEGGIPIGLAAVMGLLLGTAAGAVNGALIVWGRIPDLVVTLATMAIFRGLAQAVAQNRIYSNLPEGYRFLGEGLVAGIPVQWIVIAGSWVAVYLLLHRSRLGRYIYALGANRKAARFARVPAAKVGVGVYALSGLAASVAAILYTARSNAAKSDDAMGFELEAITCVVLGGASISGGRGSALGVFLGFLLLSFFRSGLDLTGVPEIRQRVATGVILVVMAAVNERLATGGENRVS
jgi:rhamnose transport system permease protein